MVVEITRTLGALLSWFSSLQSPEGGASKVSVDTRYYCTCPQQWHCRNESLVPQLGWSSCTEKRSIALSRLDLVMCSFRRIDLSAQTPPPRQLMRSAAAASSHDSHDTWQARRKEEGHDARSVGVEAPSASRNVSYVGGLVTRWRATNSSAPGGRAS